MPTARQTLSVCALTLLSSVASAEPYQGVLTDAATGTPIPGAEVRVLGTNLTVHTNDQGAWSLELPPGRYEIALSADLPDGERQRSRLVRQDVPQTLLARPNVFTTYFLDQGFARRAGAPGLPAGSGRLPVDAPSSLPIQPSWAGLGALTVPESVPMTIRVGRRANPDMGCSGAIVRIEEMSLEEYTRGVLPPEIGVFRSIPGASEVYKMFALAAKSYGLWFTLRYGPDNRRTVPQALPPDNHTWFHIDDTACNQRYSDQRLTITTDAADSQAGKILVKKGDPTVLDKLEYAASCGQHGTLPEYGDRDALIPDNPPVSSCVRTWCGHNRCAGHETNPAVPNEGRCLVRGICQWGAASWGEAGKTYDWMLEHYQPGLEIHTLGEEPVEPMTTVGLTGYVYTDPENILETGISGALVRLSDGQETTTDETGRYRFDAVALALGSIGITANAAGYQEAARDRDLMPGEANWASVQLFVEGMPVPDMTPEMRPDLEDRPIVVDMPPDIPAPPTTMTPGKLGPLVQASEGTQGGCCAQVPTESPATPWALLLVGMGVILRRRERS